MRAVGVTGIVAGAVAVAGAGAVLLRRLSRHDSSADQESRERWRAVTVLRPPDEVMPERRRPAALAELGDQVEVEVRPAPGDRGTELRARLTDRAEISLGKRVAGNDPRQQVRTALRDAKQALEVGEVLRMDPRPHGHRPATLPGKLLDAVSARAKGEGLL